MKQSYLDLILCYEGKTCDNIQYIHLPAVVAHEKIYSKIYYQQNANAQPKL